MAVWPVRVIRRWDDGRLALPLRSGARPLVFRLPLPRRRRTFDPFEALGIQLSLSRLAAEIGAIRRDDVGFARAHHLRAATAAYDGLLGDACRLAGIVLDADPADAMSRLQAEAQLAARGWTW